MKIISWLSSDGPFEVPFNYLTRGQDAHTNEETVSENMTMSIRFIKDGDGSQCNGQARRFFQLFC